MTQLITVVTGGGTGIGRAVAEELSRRGVRVRCLGMDADPDLPRELELARADVTSDDAVQAASHALTT